MITITLNPIIRARIAAPARNIVGPRSRRSFLAAIPAASPSWHRRLRARRASARKQLARGCITFKAARTLIVHHATPPLQKQALKNTFGSRQSMSWKGKGKSKPWRQTAGSDGREYASSYYSDGYGAAHNTWTETWQGYNHKDAKKEAGKSAFPAYNQQQQKDITVIAEQRSALKTPGVEEDAIKEIQKAVNAARKAEQRVAKLQSDLQKGQSQWASYELALKKSYAAERGRYQSDQSRLRQELADAMAAQTASRGALRAAAVGQLQAEGPAEATAGEMEVEEAWVGLMADTSMVETGEQVKELNGWLQTELDRLGSPETASAAKARLVAAMQVGEPGHGQGHFQTPTRRPQTGIPSPSAGTRESTSAPAGFPKALYPFGCAPEHARKEVPALITRSTQYREEEPAVSDPYQVSPSWEARGHPKVEGLMTPPSGKHRRTPRSGVKDTAKPKGPATLPARASKQSLADKLLASRIQAEANLKDGDPSNGGRIPIILDDDNGHLNVPIPSGSDLEQLDQ